MEIIERFSRHYRVEPGTGCWLWTSGLWGGGYGAFFLRGKKVQAHRFSYEHHVGPIPEGLDVDHLCRVRHCVNPKHLEPVTRKVNINRGLVKGHTWLRGRPNPGTKGQTHARGEGNGRAKVTEEQVAAIRADPRSQETIAREYGISQSSVSRLKRGETWRSATI